MLPLPAQPANAALDEVSLDSESVFDGRLLKVFRDRARLPDGSQGWREYIRHPGAVVIVGILPDARIILERQFRYPCQQAFIELPAGKIDPGEPLLACAQRELREETGFVAAHWRHVGTLHPCIGYSDEHIEIFLARDLVHVGSALDAGEFLEIFALPPQEIFAAVERGEITDGKTLGTLLRVLPELGLQIVSR